MAIKFNFQYQKEMFNNLDIKVKVEMQKWFQERYTGKTTSPFFQIYSERELKVRHRLQGDYLMFFLDGRTIDEVNTEIDATSDKHELLEKLDQIHYEAEVDVYCFDVARFDIGTIDDIANALWSMCPVALKVCKDKEEIKTDAETRLEYIKENLHMFAPIMG